MIVTVSVPNWLTEAQARKEVRTRITELCRSGFLNPETYDELHEADVKVRKIAPWSRPND